MDGASIRNVNKIKVSKTIHEVDRTEETQKAAKILTDVQARIILEEGRVRNRKL